MSGWKILGAIVAVILVVVVVVGLLMFFRLIPIPGPLLALLVGAREPEYSARYYPPETIAYGWMTLIPGEGQIEDMQDILGRFNEYPGFADFVEEMKIDFLNETGIDFDDEVLPWIGPEISAGLIDFDVQSELPIAAIVIAVRDKGKAEGFLDKWRDYMQEENGAEFDTGSYRGTTTWVYESAHQAYALTGDSLVYATDEEVLITVLDRMDGDDDDSLADTAKFVGARAALPERRFHSAYVDYQAVLDLIGEAALGFGPVVPGVIGPATFAENAPEWVAISGSWVERGVVVEMVSPTISNLGLRVPDLDDPAEILPDDTFGFMAASFDPNVANWRKALGEYSLRDVLPDASMIDDINKGLDGMTPDGGPAFDHDATVADALDLGFTLAKQFTGIDLENDFFAHLAGEMIISVREFDFEVVSGDPTANAVDATLMLSYQDDAKEPLVDTMDKVGALLMNFAGLTPDSVDIGGENEAELFDLNQSGEILGGEIGYMPGYVLHDEYLTIGSTEEALASTVALQNGGSGDLASNDEYQRAAMHLPGNRQFLGYVAVNRIVSQLDAQDFGLEDERYQVIEDALGVVMFSSDIATDHSRTTTVLTLFPE